MWGREDIELKDRSWRLLENRGQQEIDVWSLWGTGAGVATLGAFRLANRGEIGARLGGWKIWVGATAAGNAVGVVGYMAWRHGIKGGKWDESRTV